MIIFRYQGMIGSTYDAVDLEVRKICGMMGNPEYQFTHGFLFLLDYTLRELLNNAVEHGNRMRVGKKVKVWIGYHNRVLDIKILDAGEGFVLASAGANPDEGLTLRNRGLASVQAVGFQLESDRGLIYASLNLTGTGYLERE